MTGCAEEKQAVCAGVQIRVDLLEAASTIGTAIFAGCIFMGLIHAAALIIAALILK